MPECSCLCLGKAGKDASGEGSQIVGGTLIGHGLLWLELCHRFETIVVLSEQIQGV